MIHESKQKAKSPLSRRKFIAKTGLAAAALTIIKPSLIRASKQNSKLEVGVVGLGGRGSLIAKMLSEHQAYQVVASASLDCYAHGTQGYAETRYWGQSWLRSNLRPYKGGMVENLYTDGISRNLDRFYHDVINKDFSNTTVTSGIHSTLACILGRDAAEQNRELTWEGMMKENRLREVNLEGLKK